MSDITDELIRRLTKLERAVQDLVKPEVGRWIDWTPTVTQSGAVTVTVTVAKYKVFDSDLRVIARLAVTGSGTTANPIIIAGWPTDLNPSPAGWPLGVALIYDTSASINYTAICRYSSSNILLASMTANNFLGVNPAIGLANGDSIFLNMCWRI